MLFVNRFILEEKIEKTTLPETHLNLTEVH